MDSVIRACIVYFVLWAIIRISGRRTLGEMTAFDFILFLIIGGSTQRAITGQDYSLTNALILVATFVTIEIALSLLELKSPWLRRVFNSTPSLLVENGNLMTARLRKARLVEENILEAARRLHGLERLDQIKFAILEASGEITIVPAKQQVRRDTSGENDNDRKSRMPEHGHPLSQ
ncbi:MAG TPA: YetF domain-containing protein [Pseudolabrys sp.]|nr:YetF domain-containing protein [Pseudolabrys sp.]